MRLIFDASVIIRMAFFADSHAKEAFSLINTKGITLLMCSQIEEDWTAGFCGVYAEIAKKNQALDIRKMVKSIWGLGPYIIRAEKISLGVIADYSLDPGDNKYIQCAIDGNADYILSQDGDHLLALNNSIPNSKGEKIQIVSPWQFLLQYRMKGKGVRVSNFK